MTQIDSDMTKTELVGEIAKEGGITRVKAAIQGRGKAHDPGNQGR